MSNISSLGHIPREMVTTLLAVSSHTSETRNPILPPSKPIQSRFAKYKGQKQTTDFIVVLGQQLQVHAELSS